MSKYSLYKTPFEIQKDLAKKIRSLRRQAGYSQANLADRSGVSLGSLKRFEATGQISIASFLKLLLVLDRLHEMEGLLLPKENMDEIEKLFSDKTRE
jgi:transcriptional regulator with XRE-family HTH domain